jgi:2-C-methyl-D-erythritol 2,4-cyclodiphosphate synthase
LPANGKVAIIENIHPNIKITNPNDIAIAKALLSEDRSNGKFRIGNGYDVHRLVPGRDLILGGVRIEWDLGLLGHSDADVVIHALSDAILGALALPDIGVFFQDTDPNNRDLNSREILLFAKNKLRKQNFEISNLDITILAEGPKLAPFIGAMRNSIGEMLNIQPSQIGIKATTNEGLDAIGKKEAIAALATVLLIPCMD